MPWGPLRPSEPKPPEIPRLFPVERSGYTKLDRMTELQDIMTDKIALYLGIVVFIAIAADLALRGTTDVVFLGKKLADLLNWLAFWR